MADDVANSTFEYLRRIDAKLDRVLDHVGDQKTRMMTVVEGRLAQVELSVAGVNRHIDRVEARVERIERRHDLVDLPH